MLARIGCLAFAAFALGACDQVSGAVANGLSRIGAPADSTSAGIRTLSLLDGAVRVRGPEGYCIDQGASDARRGFAVMAGCALMSRNAGVMPALDGLITVQFGQVGTASVAGNEAAFAALLASDAGRALLASNGDAATVPQVSTVTGTSGVLARFEDTSGPAMHGTSGPQWRGFMDVRGRLVTVSVHSFDRAPLSARQGEQLLVTTLQDVAAVNDALRTTLQNR